MLTPISSPLVVALLLVLLVACAQSVQAIRDCPAKTEKSTGELPITAPGCPMPRLLASLEFKPEEDLSKCCILFQACFRICGIGRALDCDRELRKCVPAICDVHDESTPEGAAAKKLCAKKTQRYVAMQLAFGDNADHGYRATPDAEVERGLHFLAHQDTHCGCIPEDDFSSTDRYVMHATTLMKAGFEKDDSLDSSPAAVEKAMTAMKNNFRELQEDGQKDKHKHALWDIVKKYWKGIPTTLTPGATPQLAPKQTRPKSDKEETTFTLKKKPEPKKEETPRRRRRSDDDADL